MADSEFLNWSLASVKPLLRRIDKDGLQTIQSVVVNAALGALIRTYLKSSC